MGSDSGVEVHNISECTEKPEQELIRRLVTDINGISKVIPNDVVIDSMRNLGKKLIEAADALKLIRDQPDAFAAYAPTKRKRCRRRKKVSFCDGSCLPHYVVSHTASSPTVHVMVIPFLTSHDVRSLLAGPQALLAGRV